MAGRLGPITVLVAALTLVCTVGATIAVIGVETASPLLRIALPSAAVAGVIVLALTVLREREQRRVLADFKRLHIAHQQLRTSASARESALRAEARELNQQWRDAWDDKTSAVQRLTTHLVQERIAAVVRGAPIPDAPSEPRAGDDIAEALHGVVQVVREEITRRDAQHADRHEALRQVLVALARRVQPSAHRIQESATRLADARISDELVQETMMRIDHAAAQQARAAQSLAVLCREWPGQQWPDPMAFVEVVRAASGRIVDYRRVKVIGDHTLAAAASVVEQLIHLVAELLANATSCSPPTTLVEVEVRQVQRGAVITIDDGGVGLDEHRLATYTAIASGERLPELEDMVDALQTGLLVVGMLAHRHNFRVSLSHSAFGGVRAVVLVPEELVEILAPPTTSPHAFVSPVPTEAAPASARTAAAAASLHTPAGAAASAVDGLPQRRSPRRSAARSDPRPPAPPVPAAEQRADPTEFLTRYLDGGRIGPAASPPPSAHLHHPAAQKEEPS
ncbi:hypothetical protein GCM10009733_007860 [Nonomuraea maheshkhaliensis]|uniref:histidine kinase n=2 Tax=Nonomuraea maheshkhaliensis TaxID=419590 RepID=A0ABN2EPX3_9ACTN